MAACTTPRSSDPYGIETSDLARLLNQLQAIMPGSPPDRPIAPETAAVKSQDKLWISGLACVF